MTLIAAFAWLLGVLAVLCVLVAAGIIAWRLVRRRRDRRVERTLGPLRASAYDLATGDPEEVVVARRRLAAVDEDDWPPLQHLLVGFFARISGEGLGPVRELLVERGVVERARRDLHARSAVRRGLAAQLLGLVGDRSARSAIELLVGDRDPEIRVVACRALGSLGDHHAAGVLLAALTGPRPVPAGAVTDALLRLGPDVQDALQDALARPDAIARGVVADVAGLRGFAALTPALRDVLGSASDPEVRSRAAMALGRLGVPQALPELAAATLVDQPATVRLAAAEALGLLGEPAAARILTPLLDTPGILADTAARALVHLGPTGVGALRDATRVGVPSAAAGALAVASLRETAQLR